jgi:hypothetical protein
MPGPKRTHVTDMVRPSPRRVMRTRLFSGMNCGQSPSWPEVKIFASGRQRLIFASDSIAADLQPVQELLSQSRELHERRQRSGTSEQLCRFCAAFQLPEPPWRIRPGHHALARKKITFITARVIGPPTTLPRIRRPQPPKPLLIRQSMTFQPVKHRTDLRQPVTTIHGTRPRC